MSGAVTPHPLAGKPAPPSVLIDVDGLQREFVERRPDVHDPRQLVAFGTSGHRGTPLTGTLTAAHVLAIAQAICDYRRAHGIDGVLCMGKDTHALSPQMESTALQVLAANGVETLVQRDHGLTTTPAVSHAILTRNRQRPRGLVDGIVITPSHNPPEDGGIKYNPPHGGPADTATTRWIERRANELLRANNKDVKTLSVTAASGAATTHQEDFVAPYVDDLVNVIDMETIRSAGVTIGVDPLGGAALPYWEAIQARYGLNITIVNPTLDPAFGFMTLDYDGRIRMDCSSPFAMARLIELRSSYAVACGNDPDADRHGIVTSSAGLMNPNHYLAVAIDYLSRHRPDWPSGAGIGKTVVSSSLIDRVTERAHRPLTEVPVGFKWFAPMLFDGRICFGGEESAGASFLRMDGTVWTTDKDGLILALLAAEIAARTSADPGEHYRRLTATFGTPHYTRIDAPASPEQKARLKRLAAGAITATELAGDPIVTRLDRAPGNDEPIDGVKIGTRNGWFAARPSGTENVYKIYAESLRDAAHLDAIVAEAQQVVDAALVAGT